MSWYQQGSEVTGQQALSAAHQIWPRYTHDLEGLGFEVFALDDVDDDGFNWCAELLPDIYMG